MLRGAIWIVLSLGVHGLALLGIGQWHTTEARLSLDTGTNNREVRIVIVRAPANEKRKTPPKVPKLESENPKTDLLVPVQDVKPEPESQTAQVIEHDLPPAQAAHERIASASLKPATPIVSPAPKYPEEARKNGIEGHVTLTFRIRTDGRVEDIQLKEDSGSPLLAKAAVTALEKSRFRPATRAGIAVSTREEQMITFELIGD